MRRREVAAATAPRPDMPGQVVWILKGCHCDSPGVRRHAPAEGEGVVDLGRGDLSGVRHESGHVVIAQPCFLNDELALLA